MSLLTTLLKWIFIILFFTLSLLVVYYFKQKKAKADYRKRL